MNRLRSQNGTSLIEVISAVGLWVVVATGLTTSVVSNIQLNNHSRTIAAATALLQNQIEQLRSINPVANTVPADLTVGAHNDPSNPITALGRANGTFTRSWTVTRIPQYLNGTVVGNRPDIVQVAVQVSWNLPVPGTVKAVTYACISPTCG